jgi:hypothetical protein
MKLIVFAAAGLSVFVILCLWMITKISYRIGESHLKISCLGVAVRRVALTDIKRISKRRPSRLCEVWYNTFHPNHRILAIQRYRGIRKWIVISPPNRYIFLQDLQRAIQRVKPDLKAEAIIEQSPEEPEPSTQS